MAVSIFVDDHRLFPLPLSASAGLINCKAVVPRYRRIPLVVGCATNVARLFEQGSVPVPVLWHRVG